MIDDIKRQEQALDQMIDESIKEPNAAIQQIIVEMQGQDCAIAQLTKELAKET